MSYQDLKIILSLKIRKNTTATPKFKQVLPARCRVGLTQDFVTLGSDLTLKCGIVSPKEEVVLWKWSQSMDHKSDRVLSVGKMLVRNDGKGGKKNIFLLL